MNPRELLALLTARVQRFHLAPGGIPNITPEDIAHALGMIHHPEARLYARVKYCGQDMFAEELALSMRRHALMSIAKPEWKVPRELPIRGDKEWWLDMCRLALIEAVDPMTCTWCNGRAEVQADSKRIVCSNCRGTGKKGMNNASRARHMGVSREAWGKDSRKGQWATIYREIQVSTVDKYEDLVTGALRKRLG